MTANHVELFGCTYDNQHAGVGLVHHEDGFEFYVDGRGAEMGVVGKSVDKSHSVRFVIYDLNFGFNDSQNILFAFKEAYDGMDDKRNGIVHKFVRSTHSYQALVDGEKANVYLGFEHESMVLSIHCKGKNIKLIIKKYGAILCELDSEWRKRYAVGGES